MFHFTESELHKNIENESKRNSWNQKGMFPDEYKRKMKKEKERARLEEIKDRNKNESAVPLKEDLMAKAEAIETIESSDSQKHHHTVQTADKLKHEEENEVTVLSEKKEFRLKDKEMKRRADAEEVRWLKDKERENKKEEQTKEIGMSSDWILEVEDVEFQNLEEELERKKQEEEAALAAAEEEEEKRRMKYYEMQLEKRRQNDARLKKMQLEKVSFKSTMTMKRIFSVKSSFLLMVTKLVFEYVLTAFKTDRKTEDLEAIVTFRHRHRHDTFCNLYFAFFVCC